HRLPWDGYIKAGRFVPSYGWKFDDHTMYVRSEQNLFPPAFSDVGVEAGIAPWRGRLNLQVGLVNGNRGSTQDNDRNLAGVLNSDLRFHVGPIVADAGVEGYTQPGPTQDLYSGGVHGYLYIWNVTWLGEADLKQTDASGGPVVTGFV